MSFHSIECTLKIHSSLNHIFKMDSVFVELYYKCDTASKSLICYIKNDDKIWEILFFCWIINNNGCMSTAYYVSFWMYTHFFLTFGWS